MQARFTCLNQNNVINARISDHHPIIHDGVLFWNIMMQAGLRKKSGYNNGFGMVETSEQYMQRLAKGAEVIAEIISSHPSVTTITICEGPIKPLHIESFTQSLKKFQPMGKFFQNDNIPNMQASNMGLIMLTERQYSVHELMPDFIPVSLFFELVHRVQIWKLTNENKHKYIALAHFPFAVEKNKVNEYRTMINELVAKYANDEFIFCADFNLNPYLISHYKDREGDKIVNNNSILLVNKNKSGLIETESVTVDGILLSAQEKRKYHSLRFNLGLFSVEMSRKKYLIQNRHKDFNLQKEYDDEFAIVPYL